MQANPRLHSPCADMAVQRAALALCLAPYPHWRTIPELAREMDCGDAVERAVVDLVGIGLLECRASQSGRLPLQPTSNGCVCRDRR